MRTKTVVAAVLAACSFPVGAQAHESACHPRDELSTCVPSDNQWRFAQSPWLTMAPASLTGPRLSLGFAASYLHRPIGLRISSADPEGTTVYAVEHTLSATFMVALRLARRLAVEIDVPAVLFQDGAGKADVTGAAESLPVAAIGDLRWGAHVEVFTPAAERGPALSLRWFMAAPTGDEHAFVSSPGVVFAPGASFEYRRAWRELTLGADLGARLGRYAQLAGAIVGNQISLAVGARYPLLPDSRLTLGLEATALFGLERQTEQVVAPGELVAREQASTDPHIPAEWLLTVSSAVPWLSHLHATVGGGTLIPTGPTSDVTAPLFRVVAALRYR